MPEVVAPYADLDLKVHQGAPWSFAWTVAANDWSGTYTCDVRVGRSEAAALVAEPTVTATFSDPDTDFLVELSKVDADLMAPGVYYYDLRKSTGEVRSAGRVMILATVTP